MAYRDDCVFKNKGACTYPKSIKWCRICLLTYIAHEDDLNDKMPLILIARERQRFALNISFTFIAVLTSFVALMYSLFTGNRAVEDALRDIANYLGTLVLKYPI